MCRPKDVAHTIKSKVQLIVEGRQEGVYEKRAGRKRILSISIADINPDPKIKAYKATSEARIAHYTRFTEVMQRRVTGTTK